MSVKERIKIYLKSINLSITAFEESINVANGYVNSISKSIGVDKIELILENYPKLNLEWLLTGKGDMLKDFFGSNDFELRNKNTFLHDNIEEIKVPNISEKQYIIELQKDKIRTLENQLRDQEQQIEQLKKELSLVSTSKVGSKSV